ncbi:pentatricopeptide repeat-containing protein At5g56310-like [Chenopodium quinoa]|uniref:Uncharacterized protein n=1 Tax=Chenopodium quinoa TaxID=63459 RepID=A0A803LYA7_CHEQI|nr:pentatricopeptide repeat-containing protein At5g56310-like [Chenopodium quinoa]
MLAIGSLISKLKLCSSPKHIHQIHGFLLSTGLHHDNFLLSKFIESCSRFNLSHYGYSVFNQSSQPCIYLYNTMIKSLSSHHSSAPEAIFLFNIIRVFGLVPDSYSFPFVLKAASRVCDGNAGKMIHGQSIKSGFELNIHVVIAIVQMYSSCGCLEDARKVFDRMSSSNDVALWNAMSAGYVGVGDMCSGRALFERMTDRDVISWTTLMAGYVHVNQPEEAIEIFRRMRVEGVELDEVALLAALSACADSGALELGEWIHDFLQKRGLRRTVPLYNALVDMYVKSGNIEKALQVFDSMQHKSVVSWTTMIVGLAFHGHGRKALEMFSRMERVGCRPNEITFIGVLSACTHVGFVELGNSYFKSMSSKYGITPKIQHYGCMVDLLGRAGCLEEAEDLVRRMPFNANAAIWGSLLAAAKMHRDSSLAAKALQHLATLEPDNSGNYALLSNTYASIGNWSEARLVRKTMRSSGVKKLPGESSIELNSCIHSFAAGAFSHPEAKAIHDILWEIHQQCTLESHEQNVEEPLLLE